MEKHRIGSVDIMVRRSARSASGIAEALYSAYTESEPCPAVKDTAETMARDGCYSLALWRDGRVAAMSGPLKAALGNGGSKKVGERYVDVFVHPEDRRGVRRSLDRLKESSSVQSVHRVVSDDGREMMVCWHFSAIGSDDRETGLLCVGSGVGNRN